MLESDGEGTPAARVRRNRSSLELGEHTLAPPDDGSGVLNEAGSTASLAPPEAPKADSLAFPVTGWERYTCIRFLGKGGMGKVFLVHDPRLRREVALKFVRGDNPEHVRRLIGEARAQARVSHERVCKVHEVDEVDGKVYIAMQYIAGQPLGVIYETLTFEERVMLLRDAAAGIHEAHRVGIIHRDLKPSNIMVERGEGGELRAYVMDFGLASSAQDDGATLSGTVIGTPRYMAPEQAVGAPGGLDRRADVYSLGATLYHLVTGKPSVEGSTLVEVVHNLVTVEPRPPRALNRDVPRDLEAIILRCLEKDRTARYDSARALAEDLSRYLDGEPVLARSAGLGYRLRKRISKHRTMVAVISAALVLSAVAVGWGARARIEAARREQLVRRFTEIVVSLEGSAHAVALSPPHDTSVDHAELRQRMAELSDAIERGGTLAEGPGHYALGRAHLALGEDEQARSDLEQAWRDDFQAPQAAAALSTVMGRLYHAGLLAAEQLPRDQREAERDKVERQFRAPALTYLLLASQGASSPSRTYAHAGTDAPAYLSASLAFYSGQLDDALRALDRAGPVRADAYELPQLRGDILLARALQRRDHGELKPALADFDASREAYATAAVIGRSVPAIYKSLAYVEHATFAIEMYRDGDVTAAFKRGIAATRSALVTEPDDADALVREASLYRSMAEYGARSGGDVTEWLDAAVKDAERAVDLPGAPSRARQELSDCYRQRAEVHLNHGQDPTAFLRKAIAATDTIAPADRTASYFASRGLIYKVLGDYEDQVGTDALADRGAAIDAFQHALQLDPNLHAAAGNLAATYAMRASDPRAQDAEGDLERAIAASEKAQKLNSSNFIPYMTEGDSHDQLAQLQRARGLDPAPTWMRALDAYNRGLEVSKTSAPLHGGIGTVALEQAQDAWERGENPEAAFARAQAAFTQATTETPEDGYVYYNLGALFALRGRLACAHRDSPTADIGAAVGWMRTAIARLPTEPRFQTMLASAHLVVARDELERGRDPEPRLREATAALAAAAKQNANDAMTMALRGELLGIRARFRAAQHQPFDFAPAETAYQRAITLASKNPDYQLGLGQLYADWARVLGDTRGDPATATTAREHGLAIATKLLANRPTWADARVLRASLSLAAAERADRPDARRALGAQAAADFDQALAINGNLAPAWRARADRAHQLAHVPPTP